MLNWIKDLLKQRAQLQGKKTLYFKKQTNVPMTLRDRNNIKSPDPILKRKTLPASNKDYFSLNLYQ